MLLISNELFFEALFCIDVFVSRRSFPLASRKFGWLVVLEVRCGLVPKLGHCMCFAA